MTRISTQERRDRAASAIAALEDWLDADPRLLPEEWTSVNETLSVLGTYRVEGT